MTGGTRPVVVVLAAQAFAFGVAESLLLIAGNAIFLAAYGSKWLPLTYVAIALLGTLVAAAIARMLRRRSLPVVAIATELAVVVVFGASWAVLRAGEEWVSALLLVLFPVLLQIGFVFLGGQAGRLLDVQGLKASFPRIVSGFAFGFLAGGLLSAPLLSVVQAGDLVLVAAAASAAFAAFLALAATRFGERLSHVEAGAPGVSRPPLHRLISTRFVLLLLGYQLLSAAGTYMVEFLLFDRAAARYPDADSLAHFLSRLTIALNAIDILFLALVAGWLLRRFGMGLGITINPAVVLLLMAAMLVAVGAAGSDALSVFLLVAAARIADVSLTDGTTRTSLNTGFQVLPVDDRLALQSVVEGIGMPVAIGATGVLLFALRAAGTSVTVIVAVTVAVCVAWTVSAVLLYRDYVRSLAGALRRRLLPDVVLDPAEVENAEALHRLLASEDVRDIRLALDLLPGEVSPAEHVELERLARDPRPDVRIQALARLADEGDAAARGRLAGELEALLRDPDPELRNEALAAIGPDDGAVAPAVVGALDDPATAGAAVAALGRLGDAVLPDVTAALEDAPLPVPPRTLRLVRSLRSASPETTAGILAPFVDHPDRELGLVVLKALAAAGVDPAPLVPSLERTLREDAEHAARCLATLAELDRDGSLARALRDELDLLTERALALLSVLHGAEALGAAEAGLARERDRSLAIELLEVTLTHEQAMLALPVIRTELPDAERTQLLHAAGVEAPAETRDLVDDAAGHWRSPWLRECALYEAR